MRKFFGNKKKAIAIILTLIVSFLFIGVFGYNIYENNKKQETISEYRTAISKDYKDFKSIENRAEKLDKLKEIIDKSDKYEKSKNSFVEVSDEYEKIIYDMKKYFISEYDKVINDNTLKDIDKIEDKSKLDNAKESLNNVLSLIKSEENLVSNKSEVEKYVKNIDYLIQSYDKRLNDISEAEKKAEEERKAKEEAEKQAAEEEAKRQNNISNKNKENSSSNKGNKGSSSSGSGNSSSSNSGSNRPWNYGMTYYWYIDENGVKKEWYEDSQGNSYDLNGNYLGVSW